VIIAHGTFNAVLGAFAAAAVTPDAAAAAYLTGETGLFTLAGVATTALVLAKRYRSLRSTESDERRTQTGEHLSLNRRSRRSQAT
jgi:membrane protein implicated in regulation of membrane protease activity